MRFRSKSAAPDLHTQFEDLLDQVWRSEADWRLWDRLDAAEMRDSAREATAEPRHEESRLTDETHLPEAMTGWTVVLSGGGRLGGPADVTPTPSCA